MINTYEVILYFDAIVLCVTSRNDFNRIPYVFRGIRGSSNNIYHIIRIAINTACLELFLVVTVLKAIGLY
jgi:hypothetical protein